MRVKVTRMDIKDGRAKANEVRGCPICLALNRTLNVDEIEVPTRKIATLGKLKMSLPKKAVIFQDKLMDNQDAEVKPFVFETEIIAPDR